MEKLQVSVLIPVKNEELNIAEALQTVGWAGEVWVVDSRSKDRTAEIAGQFGAKVVQFDYAGVGPKKKNWALANIPFSHEWVLILDADERVTLELASEIAKVVSMPSADGYFVDREYIFMGRSLRSFRPNWNLRLFRHRMGRYERLATNVEATGDVEVHEHVLVAGSLGFLKSPLRHEDHRPLRTWIDNHNRYSEWEVEVYQQFLRQPTRVRQVFSGGPVWRKRALKRIWVRIPFRPLARFARFYIFRRGFLDGRAGFHYAVLMAFYEFMISLKLRERQMNPGAALARSPDPETVNLG